MDDHVDRTTPALEAARGHRVEFHKAIVALEDAAAAPAPGRERGWVADVGGALADLRRALADHVAVTEGADGLYGEIRSLHPRLAHRTEELATDHATLAKLLDEATASLRAADAAHVDAARQAVTVLLVRLFRHRQRGLDLVYEAYNSDIGASD